MADPCAQYVSTDDLKAAKESIVHIEHVATSKDANGNPALVVTDPIRGVNYTNTTLDGLFSDIAFKPVNGSFEDGGALVNRWDVLLYETNGSVYQWMGTLPHTVPPGSSPFDSSGNLLTGWVDRTDLVLRHDLAQPTGADLVWYKKPGLTGTVSKPISERFRKTYDAVADYGADPTGATSSDVQLQEWIDDLISDGFGIGIIKGIFRIDNPLLFSNMHGFTIHADAYIYTHTAFPASEYVIGFKEGGNGKIYGRFEVSAQLRTDINCGFKVWSENLGGTSNIDFYSCIPSDVKTGWKFGDDSFPNALVSEITVFGGHTSNTPRVLQCVGTQVYINFIGVQGISTLPSAFSGTTPYNITIKGSQLKWIGGELQHNDQITGAMVFNEPIVDAVHGNSYGNIAVVHTHVEIACALAVVANLSSIGTTISERTGMSFVGLHGYHSQNNGPMIAVDGSASDYTGFIHTDDISLYCGIVRTQPNISALNAHVYYDPKGFGFNFVKGYQAVTGGILHFDRTMILKVNNANGQSLTTGVNTILFSEPYANGDTDRWNINYATGSFTVPAGGLKDVSVETVLRINTGALLQLDVYVDGVVKSLGSGTATVNRLNVQLGNLNAGQVVTVRGNLSTGSAQTNGGALEYIAIYARN